MRPIRLDDLSAEQLRELDRLYDTTRDARVRTRAQMVLLAAERGLVAAEIAAFVPQDEETARRWFARYLAEGVEGLSDAPRSGAPPSADERAQRLPAAARGRHGAEPAPAHDHQPGPRVRAQKGAVEAARGGLKPSDVFYYADEFNISWHPTPRALWSPVGRQVMVPTPAQPTRRYGLGSVDWHSGEAVVITRKRKRRREVAELLEALLARHPRGTVHVAWDNASTHEDDEVEAVLRGAAGRLVLLYLPTTARG
jgi:DDE superfamily endonuclease/Winged helix-turn helix